MTNEIKLIKHDIASDKIELCLDIFDRQEAIKRIVTYIKDRENDLIKQLKIQGFKIIEKEINI